MDATTLKKYLLGMESPFSWNIPQRDQPEKYIQTQTEKCENINEENKFEWTRFTLHLLLAYELSDKVKDFHKAYEHVTACKTHLQVLAQDRCAEPLFCSVQSVLLSVTRVTEALVLLAAGHTDRATSVAMKIKRINRKDEAAVLGLKAAVYLQYGTPGHRLALESAQQARDLEPDMAEWHFLVGNAIGRIRRNEYSTITTEEINAIEKAFVLEKNASYTVQLAQLYSEYSSVLFFNTKPPNHRVKMDESKAYAVKALDRYKEALQMRPECTYMKARIAHGLMRIRWKEIIDLKLIEKLLTEAVEATPNNAMVLHDLGVYNDKFQNNIKKATYYLEKSNELGNVKALLSLIRLKWIEGLRSEVTEDIQNGLSQYKSVETQTELLAYLTVCYLLLDNDWPGAIHCLRKSLQLDPSANYLKTFCGFKGRQTDILELITNEIRLKATIKQENSQDFRNFLELIKRTNPEILMITPRVGEFERWRNGQLRTQSYRKF